MDIELLKDLKSVHRQTGLKRRGRDRRKIQIFDNSVIPKNVPISFFKLRKIGGIFTFIVFLITSISVPMFSEKNNFQEEFLH